mgnify:CR=1 FL=1
MCSSCQWEDALEECTELLDDDDYAFAQDTLLGIKDWIEGNEHVTERQQSAITNIRRSKE